MMSIAFKSKRTHKALAEQLISLVKTDSAFKDLVYKKEMIDEWEIVVKEDCFYDSPEKESVRFGQVTYVLEKRHETFTPEQVEKLGKLVKGN